MTTRPESYADAEEWLLRFKAVGGRIKVNGISMRLHPDCKSDDRCRDLWSEIRGTEHLDRWNAVEATVKRAVGSVASWHEWPVRS